jgi:hypothetical protein
MRARGFSDADIAFVLRHPATQQPQQGRPNPQAPKDHPVPRNAWEFIKNLLHNGSLY